MSKRPRTTGSSPSLPEPPSSAIGMPRCRRLARPRFRSGSTFPAEILFIAAAAAYMFGSLINLVRRGADQSTLERRGIDFSENGELALSDDFPTTGFLSTARAVIVTGQSWFFYRSRPTEGAFPSPLVTCSPAPSGRALSWLFSIAILPCSLNYGCCGASLNQLACWRCRWWRRQGRGRGGLHAEIGVGFRAPPPSTTPAEFHRLWSLDSGVAFLVVERRPIDRRHVAQQDPAVARAAARCAFGFLAAAVIAQYPRQKPVHQRDHVRLVMTTLLPCQRRSAAGCNQFLHGEGHCIGEVPTIAAAVPNGVNGSSGSNGGCSFAACAPVRLRPRSHAAISTRQEVLGWHRRRQQILLRHMRLGFDLVAAEVAAWTRSPVIPVGAAFSKPMRTNSTVDSTVGS